MKKMIALLLALMLLMSLTACGNEELEAELESLKAQVQDLQQQEPAPEGNKLQTVGATVDGKTLVEFVEATTFTATAVVPEGLVLDHWQINGQPVEGEQGQTLSFRAEDNCIVSAHFREEKKLTTINAELRFLNAEGVGAGDTYTEFVFEENYVNPITNETCEGGRISAEIRAVVPAGKKVDYWRINGVEYRYNPAVTSFVVDNLDEATTYEVVLKDVPVTYYDVVCTGCTFNGMSAGRVPAGTMLTFVGNYDNHTYRFYVDGVLYAEYTSAITVQINGNTTIEAYAIIN